jgi:hypothetical protein
MKRLLFYSTFILLIISCKGPKSGPLQKENFNKTDFTQKMKDVNYKAQVNVEKTNVKIEPGEGCITIANLFDNKKTFDGKIVKVKGKVTKFNEAIMGKNWVHIQDGTDYKGDFDLTITTDSYAPVGDTITFEGIIALDKDFGYGYKYKVLMEEGKQVQQ